MMFNSLLRSSKEDELKNVLNKFNEYVSRLKPEFTPESEVVNIEELFIKKNDLLDELVEGEILCSSFYVDENNSKFILYTTWTENSFTELHYHLKYYEIIKVISGALAIWNEEGSSDIITPGKRIEKSNIPQCEILNDDYFIPPGVNHRLQAISEETTFKAIFSIGRWK